MPFNHILPPETSALNRHFHPRFLVLFLTYCLSAHAW